MTTGITRIVDASVTRIEGVQGLASFGIPTLVTNETPEASFGSARSKRYAVGDLATVGTDWGTTSEVYRAARALVSQNRTASEFYITQRDAAVAVEQTVTWSANFAAGDVITGVVNGTAISVAFDTDQATTQGLLNAALAAANGVNTSSGAALVNTVTADLEYPLNISLSASGGASPTATIVTSNTPRTLSDDLDAALAECITAKWYLVYLVQSNEGMILSGAAWTEAQTKLFFAQSNDADIITNATDDIASQLSAAGYERTALFYRGTLTDHAPAALAGRVLAGDPGQIIFANKELSGVTPDELTLAQVGFINGKNANSYSMIGSKGYSRLGIASDGVAIEVWRDLDYLQNELNEAFLNLLTVNDKIPFTIQGVALVEATGQAVVNRMVTEGILDPGDGDTVAAPVFTAPAFADIDPSDKAARCLGGLKVLGTYSGSIIKVEINAQINLA